MFGKPKKKKMSKKPAESRKAVSKSVQEQTNRSKNTVGAKAEIGYTAKIKLPDGKVLIASETGLRDIKTLPSRIVMTSKEQALQVAKNLANAYGQGAKPLVGISRKFKHLSNDN